ncbi:hypothetical protein LDENG_00015480 [Lucifuga dentata]|nr:hypothetical protein LDENG_00015480 [Lucifuga dentata]
MPIEAGFIRTPGMEKVLMNINVNLMEEQQKKKRRKNVKLKVEMGRLKEECSSVTPKIIVTSMMPKCRYLCCVHRPRKSNFSQLETPTSNLKLLQPNVIKKA